MATMEGSLSKWTNVMKGWQFRWFVLDDNAGLLSYYTSREKMMRGVRRGCVRLRGAVIGIDDEDDCTFTVTVDGKTFHLQARDADERERWIRALEDTILRHAHRMRWDPTRPAPTLKDFDRKLADADSYLQMVIDQVQALEQRTLPQHPPASATALARCNRARDHANDMLESIKHSIVLLQIAKNTAHPVNGIFSPPPSSVSQSTAPSVAPVSSVADAVNTGPVSTSRITTAPTSPSVSIQTGVELGSECTESRIPVPPPQQRTIPDIPCGGVTLPVPETSYSSSEDEDFYDAHEYAETPSPASSSGLRPFLDAVPATDSDHIPSQAPSQSTTTASGSVSGLPAPPPVRDDGSLDYDALYEDEEESDIGSMENHGSVVAHLLSQVKIGMDLTKVALPTFILERRSLLEMYADYFAHPDVFVSIADFKDPKDRMVQVLRWYMSAYHAGRKSVVAKKPYNPVLGEVFQCHWDVPGVEKGGGSVPGGPLPWCTSSQLTFVAEQVSHHPPISAFYAEHYDKRISFCAHVWTKSKFLGLSIGVHNIGQGCISVLEYDEEYIVTFPNGYGRSILTVPWIELGGSVTITCAKTGYSANIEFHTKPFYGGKKNRITAEAFQPGDKKPFLTVSGEWNGCMEAKWADGKTEVFVDVNRIDITKKRVRPIAEQSDNESRRLWKEVTAGLRLKDIERATNAKYELEQKQRDEAKERKEKDLTWETKLFQEVGENWVYKNPLVKRLQATSYTST
ncbi:oxysterol-binding protein-related protein 9 isoform X1 [Schistocerca piceifrons]|uniref:oxysterol-binding protein-related protein 9 isoform X1 n=1 Tax=Schistocerca piceifrons TaxID=274613 RepID=UPI001F5E66C4|nr:oxysterol-binding protein-related protein 9 isoform X1 [Schistocerca piceifrons]